MSLSWSFQCCYDRLHGMLTSAYVAHRGLKCYVLHVLLEYISFSRPVLCATLLILNCPGPGEASVNPNVWSVGCVWHLIPGSDWKKIVPKATVPGVPEMPAMLQCTLVDWTGDLGTREMAQSVKGLSHKPRDLSSDLQNPCREQRAVA